MLHADWNRLEEYSAPLSAYRRMTALCQTLERERDEARAQLAAERALPDRLAMTLGTFCGVPSGTCYIARKEVRSE